MKDDPRDAFIDVVAMPLLQVDVRRPGLRVRRSEQGRQLSRRDNPGGIRPTQEHGEASRRVRTGRSVRRPRHRLRPRLVIAVHRARPPVTFFVASQWGLRPLGRHDFPLLLMVTRGVVSPGPEASMDPVMRGLSTGFTRAGKALRSADVAARCPGKAGRKRDGGACTRSTPATSTPPSAWTSARANTTPSPSHRPGRRRFDKRLPNTEPKLRELFAKLQAKHGTVLVVVDQPASIGALPLAVARDDRQPPRRPRRTRPRDPHLRLIDPG
ncbi:IS110 family transposase [Streptomyces rochei]|uniref:IS110 family transposase n=1 Tax=Streptomyces rochei TaxID=1928 RepID=UPI0036BAD089